MFDKTVEMHNGVADKDHVFLRFWMNCTSPPSLHARWNGLGSAARGGKIWSDRISMSFLYLF